MDLIQPQKLPYTLAAPGLARRYVASRAAAWPAGLLDLVELLASEVVTNAVMHGSVWVPRTPSMGGDLVVHCQWRSGMIAGS